jgi:acyl-[acyl-carrier-protein]-phospholipid O-acyltransferase/long-chain-fatty-acid--[acyl-carrier-protein] ligase
MGVPVTYHHNPTDSATIANMIRTNKLTIMLCTPTFLLSYIRRAEKEDFATLRIVITGAEKLNKKLADRFETKFGVRPMEGYGATELSPVACINVPNATGRAAQTGHKDNSIGMPLPGILAKIVDPDTGEQQPVNENGLLLIKGANVMLGYHGNPEKTQIVIHDGWYKTGDIARIDEDGFIYIVDRLSRYSKIGGEMVPHLSIEELIHNNLNISERVVFVTSVPDEKKGEQLIVLYRKDLANADQLYRIITASELPNLWKPRFTAYFPVDDFPTIGTGKLDMKKLRTMALLFSHV